MLSSPPQPIIHAPAYGKPAGKSGYTAYCDGSPLHWNFARKWEHVTCLACLKKRKEYLVSEVPMIGGGVR